MAEAVLDASAVLALLADEKGANHVQEVLGLALISAVNFAEVFAKLDDRGVSVTEQLEIRAALDIGVREFDEELAWISAQLRPVTRKHELSVGDRACLALAKREGVPALTTDRAWSKLNIGVDIRVIR